MKIPEFFKQYTLHDAGIEAIHYLPEQEKLILELEVCNAEGHIPPFVETTLDPVPVKLVFEGVSRVTGDINSLSEYNEVNVERYFPSHKPPKWIIEFIILDNGYVSRAPKELQIEAEDISWVV